MNSNTNSTQNASTPEAPFVSFKPLPNKLFWLLCTALLILAIATRFWDLAAKPFHHDESLHAYYSHIVATGGVHKYDALLHGPFLYYFVGLFQFIAKLWNADTSDFVARFPAALFGVLVVLSPLTIRRLVGNVGTLVLMSLLLVSPTNWYFGRFLREDVFTSIWVLGTVFAVALARTAPDNRPIEAELRLPGTKLATNLGDWLPGTPKTTLWCLAAAMMAFHFTNKENSYLHAFLWIFSGALIWAFDKLFSLKSTPSSIGSTLPGEPLRRVLWCLGVFSFIFIVLYSSFFRHPDGWWNGVLDGLYRKSLVYWWEQDQQRRIDGPFDYHLPILANYEFLLIPFVIAAWYRILSLSKHANTFLQDARRTLFFTRRNVFPVTLLVFSLLLLATFLLPRMALVSEACGSFDLPCNPLSLPRSCHGPNKPWACLLHISHTRHLLQIISYITFGGSAFLAAIHTQRKSEAFLWFWLTGALGTYSYVGEKVPWLSVYLVLPLLLIAGLELTRLITAQDLPGYAPERTPMQNETHQRFTRLGLPCALVWLLIAMPFTIWKGWKVAFPNAANPEERLVFTQTTTEIKNIHDRMMLAGANSPQKNVRVGMEGEATWPLAWYVQVFHNFDFIAGKEPRLTNIKAKPRFDALFLNDTNPEEVHAALPDFNIYRVPLRSWWVPKPNPTLRQILRYFFTGEVYPPNTNNEAETGKGATNVLYLENMTSDSPFALLKSPPPGKLLFQAESAQSNDKQDTK